MNKLKIVLAAALLFAVGVTLQNSIVRLHEEPAYSQSELSLAYLSMPQLLFEDLCIEHGDWSENQMARYYLDNKAHYDKLYAE